MKRLYAAALILAVAVTGALAQSRQNYINTAHRAVEDKMERDWRTSVKIEEWISSEVQNQDRDEVTVRGRGRGTKRGDNRIGRFDYTVRIFTRRRMAPIVSYDVRSWDDQWRYDDRYFRREAESLVRAKLERDLRGNLFVDFRNVSLYDGRGNLRGVKGEGTMYRRASDRRGSFTFDVRFDRRNGDAEAVIVSIRNRPDNGSGGWEPDNDLERRFIRNARRAVEEKFSRDARFEWYDEEIGDVLFGVRTVKGSFTVRGGNRAGRYDYRARLGAGTGEVQNVSITRD